MINSSSLETLRKQLKESTISMRVSDRASTNTLQSWNKNSQMSLCKPGETEMECPSSKWASNKNSSITWTSLCQLILNSSKSCIWKHRKLSRRWSCHKIQETSSKQSIMERSTSISRPSKASSNRDCSVNTRTIWMVSSKNCSSLKTKAPQATTRILSPMSTLTPSTEKHKLWITCERCSNRRKHCLQPKSRPKWS